MSATKNELIRKFVRAIKEGNAAVFAGAGLSRPSGFVDWKGLLRPLAADIGLDVDKETDLLAVAQYYRNQRGTRTPISQAIMDAFSKDAEANENIEILSRLPIATYWTTNYDELLENAIRNANRDPDVKSESDQFSVIKANRDAVVYKMHGDVNHAAHAVLTKTDYELYEIKRPLFRTALKGDLITKKFLFIGFSFADPNLDYVLSQIRSLLDSDAPEHYCFFKRVQESEYSDSYEYGYEKAKQEMQIDNLKNYGIQTVLVDSYDEITEILREIEKASKANNIYISGAAEEFTSPWNKDKAEELAEKLADELVHKNYKIFTGYGSNIGTAVINGALKTIYKEKFRHIDEYLCIRPFPRKKTTRAKRTELYTKYRTDLLKETGVSIFIFGNKMDLKSGTIVESDGCIEEFEIAHAKENIIIPVGSTGYAAKTIFDIVKKDIADYSYLKDYLDILETETDVDKIVKAIMEIICSIEY